MSDTQKLLPSDAQWLISQEKARMRPGDDDLPPVRLDAAPVIHQDT